MICSSAVRFSLKGVKSLMKAVITKAARNIIIIDDELRNGKRGGTYITAGAHATANIAMIVFAFIHPAFHYAYTQN